MIKFLARTAVTFLFAYSLAKALVRLPGISGGDMIFLLGYSLAGAVLMAILWAPVVGEKLSDPITSTLNSDTSVPPDPNRWVQAIRWLQHRRYHRLALLLVFMEGIRHPTLPHPALLGLRSVRPGSLLERWFAREVFNYNNIQNCLQAYRILTERHGIIPPMHRQPEVNLAISGLTRQPPPEPAKYQVPQAAPKTPPAGNSRIKLFEE
ncbi:MAG TPA: hypothetical protein VFE51_21530 [Verrucomicrobiae bacterium]|nr:hypothetical protein [Verrucomicrobiae bacterium]